MASFGRETNVGLSVSDIARMRNGDELPPEEQTNAGAVRRRLSLRETNRRYWVDSDALALKTWVSVAIIVVLAFSSLCFMGASGQYYPYSSGYAIYTPDQVLRALYEHAYNAVANGTHLFAAHSNQWILDNVPGYWAIANRLGVIVVTLICSVLLGISGMVYQVAFRNPIAGPTMLGVNSGVSLGLMILVAVYAGIAPSMLIQRYALCYGCGAAILALVVVASRSISNRSGESSVMSMLLIGAIVSQLAGFVVSFVTLYVMSEEDYLTFYSLSQMLSVDTSPASWLTLVVASLVSFVPICYLRYRLNGLSMDGEEARLLGLDQDRLRTIALVCGAIMILAAQVHIGAVAIASLIVPFIARSWFGCEFSKQFTGVMCISPILLLICRDIADLIPFIGDGLAIGSVVSVVALPLLVVVVSRQFRGWE